MQQANGSPGAVQVVGVLHQMVLESVLAASKQELAFRMLNRTVGLCRYDRALLFQYGRGAPKLLGISGQSDVNANSEKTVQWTRLAKALQPPEGMKIIAGEDFRGPVIKDWEGYAQQCSGTSVLWLPVKAWGKTAAGLWLERWNGAAWSEPEERLLASLALGYGAAWERLHPRRPALDAIRRVLHRKRTLAAALACMALLLLFRLPLRVVAPCEVAAKSPFVVTAPLAGVVEAVLVQPGDPVRMGQPLFVYDKRVAEEELQVAREQVEIIGSRLDRARTQAFADPRAHSEIKILEHQLEQEKARLGLAEYRVSKLEVRAGTDGVAVLTDPERWRGRPVSVGERVLSVVDPADTKVEILVPEDDNMDFDKTRPARVLLNVFPETVLTARISYVGMEVVSGPQGVPGVEAEAQWIKQDPRVKIGLKGVAVMYGPEAPLAYWLFRKPWAAVNEFFGL